MKLARVSTTVWRACVPAGLVQAGAPQPDDAASASPASSGNCSLRSRHARPLQVVSPGSYASKQPDAIPG